MIRILKIFLLILLLPIIAIHAQQRQLLLSGPDISNDSQISLIIRNPVTEGYAYNTAVLGRADTLKSEAVTVFPENSAYFPERNELRIYNHFGLYHYEQEKSRWYRSDFIPSFSDGNPVSPLKLLPVYHSPDGRYTLYVKEEENLSVGLYLYDYDRNVSISISGALPRDFSTVLAKWSPDSRYFIYRRNKELYYYSIDQYLSSRIPAEEFRKLGHRYMNSASWGKGNYLYLFSGKLIYRVHSSEFFTRSFYADPFQKGAVWGRIPLAFDPLFDSFTINGTGSSVFIVRDGRDGFVFPLSGLTSSRDSLLQSPHIKVPYGFSIDSAGWTDNHTLVTHISSRDLTSGRVYYLDDREGSRFLLLSEKDVFRVDFSPEKDEIALLEKDSVTILENQLKEIVHTFEIDSPLKVYWTEKGYILLGRALQKEISDGEERLIGLSQADVLSFTADNKLLAGVNNRIFQYSDFLEWQETETEDLREGRLSNDTYRIYLEDRPGSWYARNLKIRKNDRYTTSEFFRTFRKTNISEALPVYTTNSREIPWYFSKGNSRGRKEVTLVINAVNSSEGLLELLDLLSGYGIPVTFFVNGDFINNYPDSTRLISESGHSVGSLFYTYFNMADPRYQINREFLKKGLARNEDDYFITTGKEMSMIWHTPYYYLNKEILDTTGVLNYIYVGKELDIPDWVGTTSTQNTLYKDNLTIIHDILDSVVPGTIIPVTLGKFSERDDYLYRQLGMLIEGLILQGYDFVSLESFLNSKY